ncbi:unnamed protein product [Aphanomyces euteiches]|uniref:SET domain-containing protein n=1 Tax=Aphanomyces euteiches TaxID=100861 RepID=A0A6G0XDU0_9STRA|nr:hypothetical protein Ae201684_005874 [Aphanomyces euteiches]KAH9078171.1 hypothetical protein Ae201684P_019268 [Aphanomyces euteiches]
MPHCLDQGDPDDAQGDVAYCGQRVSCSEMSRLMGCVYTRHVLFQSSHDLRNYCYWGYSSGLPLANERDVAALDQGLIHPDVEVRPIEIPGLGSQLGLFATQTLKADAFFGEYTGVIQADRGGGAFDSYGLAYPSLYQDGDMCISAKEYGNVIRCVNHSSTNFNAIFTSILHRGMLRMICKTIRETPAGSQILVNYGQSYWKQAGIVPFEWPTYECQ